MLVSEKNFTVFSELEKLDTCNLFSIISGNEVDTTYLALFSNRKLTEFSTVKSCEDIAKLLNNMYVNKWNDIINADNIIRENLSKGNITKTTKTPISYEGTTIDSLANLSSETFNNSNKTVYSYKVNNDEINISESMNIINMRNFFSYLKNNILYDIVFTDTNSCITLNIF